MSQRERAALERRSASRMNLDQAQKELEKATAAVASAQADLDEVHDQLVEVWTEQLQEFDFRQDDAAKRAKSRMLREHAEWNGMRGEPAEDYQ